MKLVFKLVFSKNFQRDRFSYESIYCVSSQYTNRIQTLGLRFIENLREHQSSGKSYVG